jgi:23S rRNA (uracil1939-C5)-methyltransferase
VARQGKKPIATPNHEPIEVEITGIANGGDGIAHRDDKTLFVPFTIPGERLTVRITNEKKRYAFAEGVTMLAASADRVTPRCAHFGPGACAGCQWQHMNYRAQLALKTDILIDQLERIGGFDSDQLTIHPIIPCENSWHYAAQADFYRTTEGDLGFKSLGDERAILISECHIINPKILELVDELNVTIDNLISLRVQVNTSGDAMFTIKTRDEQAPELESTFPVSVNLLLNDNVPVNLIGDTHITHILRGKAFRITAGVPCRSNLAQFEQLIQTVLDYLHFEGFESVLDLYGGVGVFSAFIAPHVSHVTYVDSYPPAATDAEENLAELEHVDVIEGAVEEVVPYLRDIDFYYNVAVLDPPPPGLSVDVIDALSDMDVPLLVYISHDPATLARDAKRLVNNHGYALTDIQPIDFAPQTAQVQTVTIFERTHDDYRTQ